MLAFIQFDPFPRAEFLMIVMDVDVAVLAHETHQEPVLALAAIFAAPHLADQMIGQVVEIFFAAARDDFYQSAMDAGFLAEFADRRFLGLLAVVRSEEHTSELQSLMRISYAVFCLKKKKN